MNLFNSNGRRARIAGSILLLVVFVAGTLAGAASERVLRAEKKTEAAEPEPREVRGGSRRLLLDPAFMQTLELTETQRTQIVAIMDRRDHDARQVWREVEPRFKAVGDSTRREIEKVLTPEQVEKFETEIAKRHASWKDRRKCQAGDSARAGAEKTKKSE
jgi:Spy/CpxP family protein refolding chaperone